MSVYSTRVYNFACNAPGCEEVTEDILPPNMTDGARSAWRVAKEQGWARRRSNEHFCPTHGALSTMVSTVDRSA